MGIHVFGLTGGLASGKSTVAARLRASGVPVIDADQVAREVVQRGSEGLAEVVKAFGEGVLTETGDLDRQKLASIVFGDDKARKRLNAIVHPRVAMTSAAKVAALGQEGVTLACYEAPLLVENGLADAFRPLVVVAVSEDVQVQRAMARDRSTESEARARIAAQLPLAAKVKAADYVIENNGDKEAVERRTDEVLAAIKRSVGVS